MFQEKKYKKAIVSFLGDYVLKRISKDAHGFLQPFCLPAELILLSQKIAGFGDVREDPDPENVFHLQNYYLSTIAEVVLSQGGMVIDYCGDGVLSAWGLEAAGDPARAARAALACARIPAPAGPESLVLHGALHAGACLAGNVGSSDKLKFTILGQPVNFVGALVEHNRPSGTKLLTSEEIHSELKERFLFQEVDCARARGLKESTRVFELKGER